MSIQPAAQSQVKSTAVTSGFRLWRLLNTIALVVAFLGTWAILNSCSAGYQDVSGWRITLMVLTMGWFVAAENFVEFLVVLMVGIGGLAISFYAVMNILQAWRPAFARNVLVRFLYVPLAVSVLGVLSFWVYSFYDEAGFQVIHFEWGYALTWLGLISAIILESTERLYRRKPSRVPATPPAPPPAARTAG